MLLLRDLDSDAERAKGIGKLLSRDLRCSGKLMLDPLV